MNQKRYQIIAEVLHDCSASFFNKDFLKLISIEELLDIVKNAKDKRIAFRAAWALEHIVLQHVDFGLKFCNELIHLYCTTNNDSVLRCLSKIIMLITKQNDNIKEEQTENILNKTFTLIEQNDCPVALRCNAYDILFNMTLKEKWIASELTIHLNLDLERNPSAALTSRAKRILKKLERIS